MLVLGVEREVRFFRVRGEEGFERERVVWSGESMW